MLDLPLSLNVTPSVLNREHNRVAKHTWFKNCDVTVDAHNSFGQASLKIIRVTTNIVKNSSPGQ